MTRVKTTIRGQVDALALKVRWYQGFSFRLGFSFVVFAITLLTAQTMVFDSILARPRFPLLAPNNVVAIVAADIGSALARNPSLDIAAYVNAEYGTIQPAYVLMIDGTMAANRREPLDPEIRRSAEGVLAGKDLRAGAEPILSAPPFVMAPIQVAGVLRGVVVLPPAAMPSGFARDVGRMASVPGTGLLILATVVAAVFIVEPSRRRLKVLQDASRRLGAGDLSARVPISGNDEIADVAATFNSMAAALAAREQYFTTLERETRRLDRMIRDLLELARLEHRAGELEIRDFAARRLFEHVVDRHQQDIQNRGIVVRIGVSDAADQIAGDPERIEQVVETVFANALEHTPDGGCIELSARVDGRHALVTVTNSGDGIPAEHLAHVFERFYKVDQARVDVGQGCGLGLSIAKAIVERHGGTIGVVSDAGVTTFCVTLPHDPLTAAAVHASSTNL